VQINTFSSCKTLLHPLTTVMKRFERVKALKERGQWKEGQSPTGLPKTKADQ